jgi:hypothetical protein
VPLGNSRDDLLRKTKVGRTSGPDLWGWLRWPFGLVLVIAFVYETAEPFYEWTLRRQACQIMKSQPENQVCAPSPT